MNKIRLNNINLLDYLNEETIKSIQELFIKTIKLNSGTPQYVLLCKHSLSNILHNGIIAFSKSSYSLSIIGFFSIHVTTTGIVTSASQSAYKFYDVTYRGERYVAIVKPLPGYDQCKIQSFSFNTGVEEYIKADANELTNIIAL